MTGREWEPAGVPRRRAAVRNRRGVSLVELLTSLLLVSTVAAMSYSFARAAWLTARTQERRSEVLQATALALDMLARDVRIAGFSAAAEPLDAVRAAGPQSVEVACDLNGDGDVADTHELIAYRYDAAGRRLMRATGGTSPQPLAQNMTAFALTFRDAAGTDVGVPTSAEQRRQVRRLDVSLSAASSDPHSPDAAVAMTATATVHLRNP